MTADPQSRTNSDGKTVCNFSVAVNRRQRREGQQEADFFRVAAWNQLGENCQKFLAKGRKVCVVGPVSVRTYQAQDGSTRANMEVTAQDVEFLGGQGGNQNTETPAESAPASSMDGLPF